MNILSTIDIKTTNREPDISFKTPIVMEKFEEKTYFHLICNNVEVYDLFKQLGEYVQETRCITHNHNEDCAHKHSHVILKLNPDYVVKNAHNPNYLTNRMSYLVRTKLDKMKTKAGKSNRRQFLCKRINCSSHYNGTLHYMGCNVGQSTKANGYTPHEHYNRRSFCLHKRKPISIFDKPTTQCWNIMAQIEVLTGNKLHLMGRDNCPCIEKRVQKEVEERLKTMYRNEASKTVNNKTHHKDNVRLRADLYSLKADRDRNEETANVHALCYVRDGKVLGLISHLNSLDKSTFFA
jgi:hypothetical protein